jgi:hypothetical protein
LPPGSAAPRIAQFAKDFKLHYITLPNTLPKQKKLLPCLKILILVFLQTGLAPDIDLLAHELFQQFRNDYKVNSVHTLEFKVGALTMP